MARSMAKQTTKQVEATTVPFQYALGAARQRHPQVADHILVSLSQGTVSRNRLMNAGVDAPEWGDVDRGQRPSYHPDDEFPRFSRMGWQSFASTKMDPTDRALVRAVQWSATCRCGQPLDSRGHRWGACAIAGVFGSPRVSGGELCGTDLQGSRSKGVRQHPCPRLGPIFQGQEQTTVVWKWSLTVCLSSTAHSWPWTPRWSAHGAPRRQCA